MENALLLVGEFNFNLLDMAAIIIFISCLYSGTKNGLVRMVFSLVSGLLNFYITSKLYPHVSVFLKDNTNLYTLLKSNIIESLGVGEVIGEYIAIGEEAVISNLPLPNNILAMLKQSNIPSVYDILNVATLEDYIGSFLANMFLNVISAIIVFILVALAMQLIINALNIITGLPVIRKFNKIGGALAGACMGFILIWAIINLYCLLFATGPANEQIINTSAVSNFIYEHDLLIKGFSHVFN